MALASTSVVIDNDRVKATLWFFTAGSETGWHRHEFDYVIVPLGSGKLEIQLPDNTTVQSDLETGKPYFRNTGVEHNVRNINEGAFRFLKIELL